MKFSANLQNGWRRQTPQDNDKFVETSGAWDNVEVRSRIRFEGWIDSSLNRLSGTLLWVTGNMCQIHIYGRRIIILR